MPLAKNSNPFIHGCNSAVLALLPHTEFTLYSPVWMMDKYQIAPLGGEINGGGLDSIKSESKLAFGRVRSDDPKKLMPYNLERILRSYAVPTPMQQKDQLIALAKANIIDAPGSLFSKINQLLIYLTRLKQLGVPNSAWISDEEIVSLRHQADATLQFFYLLLLLGNKINPDYQKIGGFSYEYMIDLQDAINTHLSAVNIVEKIKSTQLDIKSIYENSTLSALQNVADLLAFPTHLTVEGKFNNQKRDITLTETSVFRPIEPTYDGSGLRYSHKPESIAAYMVGNIAGYTISGFLSDIVLSALPKEFFDTYHSIVLKYIEALQYRLHMLDTILNKEPSNILDTPYRSLIENAFPILLITENNEKLSVQDHYSMEYRANTPLKLGEDITMIATDSPAHQKLVQDYLHDNKLDTVTVLTFEMLQITSAIKESESIPDPKPLVDLKVLEQAAIHRQFSIFHHAGEPRRTEVEKFIEVRSLEPVSRVSTAK